VEQNHDGDPKNIFSQLILIGMNPISSQLILIGNRLGFSRPKKYSAKMDELGGSRSGY
jgi:hypothetical protein